MKAMDESQAKSLGRLRLLVAALGGATHAKWWRTEFLTEAGLRFLDRLYPRTSRAAAIRATGVAARELHDSSIGRGGVYHLFRLPERLELQLSGLAEDGFFDEVVGELESSLGSREALLKQLGALADDGPKTEPGPQRIGNVRDLHDATARRWASAYLHAFTSEYRVYPYVEEKRTT